MGLVSSAIAYLVTILVWRQVYASATVTGFPEEKLFSYLAVAFILNFGLSLVVEVRFGARLQNGAIAFDVMRPLGCLLLQLAQAVGEALGGAVVAVVLYGLAWGVLGSAVIPPDGERLLLGVLSIGFAFIVNFAIGYLAAQCLLVTLHYYGVAQARTALHQAFSGLAGPLLLLPPGLQSVARALPFRHVIETPVLIGLGLVPRSAVPALLLQQVAWGLGLLSVASLLFNAWFKRHQLQGG